MLLSPRKIVSFTWHYKPHTHGTDQPRSHGERQGVPCVSGAKGSRAPYSRSQDAWVFVFRREDPRICKMAQGT